jgi:N-formylmaleamate deformylase
MTPRSLIVLALAAGCSPAPGPQSPAAAAPAPAATPTPAAPATEAAPFTVTVTGHGPPVLFIPGLSSPGSVFHEAVAHLAARHTCYVFTLAGFAGVPATSAAAFLPTERDAILAYLRAHQLAHPVVVGHSIGGFLAYAIALQAPHEIAGVLAVDGLPFMPALLDPSTTPARVEPQAAQIRAMFATMDPAAFALQTRRALQAMITRPEDVERVLAESARSDPPTVGRAVYELMTTDLRPGLGALAMPVWLIQAGDRPGMRAAYEAQLAGVPDHRVITAAGAKHFVMLDDPAVMNTTLDQLLAIVQR